MKLQGIALAALVFVAPVSAQDEKAQVDVVVGGRTVDLPKDLTLRARVVAITPAEAGPIAWRWGGEGLGGEPVRGFFSEAPLPVGTWSPAVPVASFVAKKFPSKLFLTVVTGKGGKRVGTGDGARTEGQSTGVEMEFEIGWQGKPLKTFTVSGPDGGTLGIVIPAYRLSGGKTPADPTFLEEFSGLRDYAHRRADRLGSLAPGPRPARFGIVTDLSGYGQGHGYSIRLTDKAVLEEELKSLRTLGVNGLAGAARHHLESSWHVVYAQLGGFPVPGARKGQTVPEAGCPSAPGVAQRQAAMIQEGLSAALRMKTDEVWWRTVDEIGSVVDQSPEGKGHYAACGACADAFREWLKGKGLSPADLGGNDWADVRPADLLRKEPPAANDRGAAMRLYQTMMFSNVATARLFTPLRDTIACANEAKRSNPSLPQPLVFSFALRGNTFNMGGHSLDFFDFYRHADNAMVYETSNRDPRVWIWDSYLCDVGRILTSRLHTEFGIYVKPHRGAPIQRALAAASRGARMIYWYTYGPDYVKGDSFAENDAALEATARAASILGRAEDLLFRPAWMTAPQVAVVNPRSSELWNKVGTAQPAPYENAKWIYTALAHAHLPVDPLDEEMLATEDLSRYKVLYVSGTNLTAAAAAKVAAWVQDGGTLVTSGGGLARDEANQPLAALASVLGLEGRGPVELWSKVKPYGATTLETFAEPTSGKEISGRAGQFAPVVGREVLKPAAGTEVVATFADGGAAMTRRSAGKGAVWVAGFYPGLEYSAGVRIADYDMSTGFDPVRRAFVAAPALERVAPAVDAGRPLVEGILLRNEATGKRGVTLINWAYRQKSLVPFKDLRVAIRGAGDVSRAASVVLGAELKVERSGDVVTVLLPALDEGDVIRLE
jgi:hypothetical protein